MEIRKSVDIEDEVRIILSKKYTVYCPPLPADYSVPFLFVTATGGSEASTIDTFSVALEAYSDSYAGANELIREAVGYLKAKVAEQGSVVAYVVENTKPALYQDPVRPDLMRYRTTLRIWCHQKKISI